ncbi:phosphoenolpyruvate synthase [Vibrio galatheae]|uniref:Phosphoenolpyruvate synthase n=1 Tax=Vibrio galatheae TaxID=579748 RepID=A0A0F4NH79_9VIBR|nr:putative PEP-binding protein [Vibrio galatheae]KJY82452.1 phosphoenolpyruvate synthase [Vibrio galatheae]
MSLDSSSSLHPALKSGNFLPNLNQVEEGTHLFVSLSEMVLEHIFYHPCYAAAELALDATEEASIQAILGDLPVESHFVSTLTDKIIAAVKPSHKSIRVALSGADSHSYRSLLGGKIELAEVNPALGIRGVSRYARDEFKVQFSLECQVIKLLREQNIDVEIVVPFVRGLSDAAKIIDLLAEQGLPRGLQGLKVLYTVDVPSGALLSERLLHYFDGVVINLENLTQFTLGIDCLNEELEYLFDPESEAVMQLLDLTMNSAANSNKPVVLVSSGFVQYPRLQDHLAEQTNIELVVTA